HSLTGTVPLLGIARRPFIHLSARPHLPLSLLRRAVGICYSRTCPVPKPKYLLVTNCFKPSGPRWCSLSVLIASSTPTPICPPSVNRVEALWYTAALSTCSINAWALSVFVVRIVAE